MNLLIDVATGDPRWNISSQKLGPKEDFALEAALRLQARKLTLDQLKSQIIAAANIEWARRGNTAALETLNEVKEKIGKSGKDWFFEIKRVHAQPEILQELIDQQGRGLTALARRAGPIQAQQRKGFRNAGNPTVILDLIKVLEDLRRAVGTSSPAAEQALIVCKSDIAKYETLIKALKLT